MKKKKIISMIVASTIISGAIMGKNITAKATTDVKSKAAPINRSEADIKKMKELTMTYLDRLEKYSDVKSSATVDREELFRRIKHNISEYKKVVNVDEEMQRKFDLVKDKYEKYKTIRNLKSKIDNLLGTATQSLKYEVYENIPELAKLIKEGINNLGQYGEDVSKDVSEYNLKLNEINYAFQNKDRVKEEVNKVENKKEEKIKIQEENINKKEENINSTKRKIESDIKINENKYNENKYNENKYNEKININEVKEIKKEIKKETNNLIEDLSKQIKDKKNKVEINKTINSVEKKVEELKKYKKVSNVSNIENILKDIKNDSQNGKEIDSSKLTKLTDELNKSINLEESNENIQNEIIENMDKEEKPLSNDGDILKTDEKEVLEKEANTEKKKKSLAMQVGVGVGTVLLAASAFIINRRFRRKR